MIPVKLRDYIFNDDKTKKITITRGFDRNLMIVNQEGWEKFKENLFRYSRTTEYRKIINWFVGVAETMDIDAQGRIKIPEFLLVQFNIKKHVIITKDKNSLLVWNPDIYTDYIGEIESTLNKNLDDMKLSF
jgi:MraZ protein